MKAYFLDIIKTIQRFSKYLDDQVLFLNQRWVFFDEKSDCKILFIFRNDNELLISINGNVKKNKWEYIDNRTILITDEEGMKLYRHGFLDNSILALNRDGDDKYVLFFNESKINANFKDISDIKRFLEENYEKKSVMNRTISRYYSKSDEKKYLSPNVYFCSFDSNKGILEIEQTTTYPNLYPGLRVMIGNKVAPDGKYLLGVIGNIKVEKGIIVKAKMI